MLDPDKQPAAGERAQAPVALAQINDKETATELKPPASKTLNVLLVESDFVMGLDTSLLLSGLGHKVVFVRNAAQALPLLHESPVDLLVTDFSPPKMDGLELSKRARELQPDLPVLLVSVYATLPDGSEFPLPLLQKPYEKMELARKVEFLTRVS